MSTNTSEKYMTDSTSSDHDDEFTWIDAAAVEDLPEGEMTAVQTNPAVAVYNVDGDYYSTTDTCTHMKSSLTEGYLDGDQVECLLHMATFCVRNGLATSLPATEPLRSFETRVEQGQVQVRVPTDWVVSA